MATPQEIRQRVEQADTARSIRRAEAAQQVGELVTRRARIVEQLDDLHRQLGGVLADAQDVIGIEELAEFVDVKAADLTAWFASHKTTPARRRKLSARTSRPQDGAGRKSAGPLPAVGVPPSPELAQTDSRRAEM